MKKLTTFLLVSFLVTTRLFAGSVSVPIASGATVTDIQTAMSAAVTAGNTDITLQFAKDGIWGAASADLTLAIPAGVTKLTITADPATTGAKPILHFNTLTYADGLMTGGLTLDGVKVVTAVANRYLIAPTTTATRIPASLTIKNCWIEGHRAVLYSTLATTTSELLYTNNIFKNIGNSGIINVNTGSIPVINIRKNTFINVGGDGSGATASDYFIDFRSANSVTSQINFSNNTIYYPRTQGRGLFRLSSGTFTTGYIKENNNLYSTGNPTSFAMQLLYTNSSFATTDADSTNYYSNYMTLGSNKGSILTTVYTENTPSNLFLNPGADDFSINDANFVGKSVAGDPRWFPQAMANPKSLSTSVSPANSGTVTPSSATVSQGTIISLTATRGFGYAFKEWRGAISNAVISTANPLSVTMSTDSSLVAVFEPITTYDLTISKVGSTWANVSVNPAATNGKYEAGTSVTISVVPNGVTSFVNWDDHTTSASRIITMDDNKTVTANFTETPFISGWDFKVGSPNTNRPGDYYSDAANKGILNIYDQAGTATSWLANTGSFNPTTPCAYLWTAGATFATNRRYFQATFSTLGYTNLQVKSQMAGSYQHYLTQKMQVSLNGTDFTDLNSLDVSTSAWGDLNATLPAAYENQATVYIRWIANTSSTLVGNSTDNDGTAITNVYVYGTKTVTGLNQNTETKAFATAENTGRITIHSSMKNGKASIFNMVGQKMEETSLINSVTILNKKYNSGVYLIKFEESGNITTQKISVR